MTELGDAALIPDDLPDVIREYQAAHDRRDTDAALEAFASDAVVTDDGHTYRGTAEVQGWLAITASEFTFTRTLLSAEQSGAETWRITNHVEGNFPGGQVDLRYEFTVVDDRIVTLVIAP